MSKGKFNYKNTFKWLDLMSQGGLVEYRSIDRRKRVCSGYFRNMEELAIEVAGRCDDPEIRGHYITLNRPVEAVWSRAPEQIVEGPEQTTKDHEIERRIWLLVDLDVTRPTGISSSNLELKVAACVGKKIFRAMTGEHGWPKPVVAHSGNGIHLLWRIDLPNDNESEAAIVAVLAKMENEFGNEAVGVDQCVFNASRITKLYGTMVRKGCDTDERPHRVSKILYSPKKLRILTLKQMTEWAPVPVDPGGDGRALQASASALGSGGQGHFDLHGWLQRFAVAFSEKDSRCVLEGGCPFIADSSHEKAAVWMTAQGPRFHCFGGRCADKHWSDFRAHFDKQYAARMRNRP